MNYKIKRWAFLDVSRVDSELEGSKLHGMRLPISSERTINKIWCWILRRPSSDLMVDYIDDYITAARRGRHTTEGHRYSPKTLAAYETLNRRLGMFQGHLGHPLRFSQFSMQDYEDFLEWCFDQGFNMNYIGKLIRGIKKFLRLSHDEGIHDNQVYRSRNFTVPRFVSTQVYLDKMVLGRIFRVDLDHLPLSFREVRDSFLIGAWTGLRISDFAALKEENLISINGNKYIHVVATQKTLQELHIPLHPMIESLLKRRSGSFPKKYSNIKFNANIKEIARLAGIDNTIEKINYLGGHRVIEKHLKYELVSAHTARRSFCTNAILAGMDAMDVMALSGHKKIESFRLYVRADQLKMAMKLHDHPFFKEVRD
jgi:integrase